MPRPNVPTTRSLSLRWISRSRTAMGGIPLFKRLPVLAAVAGGEDAELGADEEQVGRHVIDGDRVGGPALGKVAADVRPVLAAIAAPQHIGLEIAVLVVVEACVNGIRVVPRGLDVRHVHIRGLVREREVLDLAPVLAAILGHLDQAVVGAGIDQALDQGRFGQGDDRCRKTRSNRSWPRRRRSRPGP